MGVERIENIYALIDKTNMQEYLFYFLWGGMSGNAKSCVMICGVYHPHSTADKDARCSKHCVLSFTLGICMKDSTEKERRKE